MYREGNTCADILANRVIDSVIDLPFLESVPIDLGMSILSDTTEISYNRLFSLLLCFREPCM